jgi:hypothetical protein
MNHYREGSSSMRMTDRQWKRDTQRLPKWKELLGGKG